MPRSRWMRPLADALAARFGTREGRRARREARAAVPSVRAAIAAFERRWPSTAPPPEDRPVFILASSWRSGSSFLQRIVMAEGHTLVWGEPWAFGDLARRLTGSLSGVSGDHVADRFFFDHRVVDNEGAWHHDWVANLYPEPEALRAAHRRFWRELYAEPARARGYANWGFKEVRLGSDEAAYLRWLFPGARFLLLHRNPYDAWRSYRLTRRWFDRWPDEAVLTPRQFGRHWRRRTEEFVQDADELGALRVSYEELCTGKLDGPLAAYLEQPLPSAPLPRVPGRQRELEPVPAAERRRLRREVEPLARELGYAP